MYLCAALVLSSHTKKKKEGWLEAASTKIRSGFHWWRAKASELPQSGKATSTTEACGHEGCKTRDRVFIPATGFCRSHECKGITLGGDNFTELWFHVWLPGFISGLERSHVPDCWRLNAIFLSFPYICILFCFCTLLLLIATSISKMFSRWILKLTSPVFSSITHSYIECIWTEKVVKIYRGNLIKFKETKEKSCLGSLNLNVATEDNPVSSRIHHTPTWFIGRDLFMISEVVDTVIVCKTITEASLLMASFWPEFKFK